LLLGQTLTATQLRCQNDALTSRYSGDTTCSTLIEYQNSLSPEVSPVAESSNMTRCQMLVLVSSNSLHWQLVRALGQDGGSQFSDHGTFSPLVVKTSCQTKKSTHCPIFMWSIVSPKSREKNNLNAVSNFPKNEQRRLPGFILALHSGENSIWDEYTPTPSLLLKLNGQATQDYGFHSLFLPGEHFVVGAVVFRW